MLNNFSLRQSDFNLKILITAFLILLTFGYSIGLLLVEHKTALTPSGITEEYKGTNEDSQAEVIKYSRSKNEMYIFLHNHITSLSVIFFVIGFIFYFSSIASNQLKTFLILEPFMSIAITFSGIWLLWETSQLFSWLVLISGILMGLSYAAMVILILIELWIPKRK
ncbi:MAG: hypothetical protein QME58_02890 [Bacteroidota bacterium]|nr:hypothetical protein [Bacteroidota bacterium]